MKSSSIQINLNKAANQLKHLRIIRNYTRLPNPSISRYFTSIVDYAFTTGEASSRVSGPSKSAATKLCVHQSNY